MKVLKYQIWHVMAILILLFGIKQMVLFDEAIFNGSFWGLHTKEWFIIAVAIPIIHQIYVVLCWRFELYYKALTKLFGKKAFKMYQIGFFILFVGRFLLLIVLALSNKNTISLNPIGKYSLLAVFTLVGLYAFYSVKTYFGLDRAAGLDHFDKSVSKLPFVKKGIFKYTENGMYKYAFLIFYIPGLVYESKAALLVALYSHIYIWVHYFCTELPDIKVIYKSNY